MAIIMENLLYLYFPVVANSPNDLIKLIQHFLIMQIIIEVAVQYSYFKCFKAIFSFSLIIMLIPYSIKLLHSFLTDFLQGAGSQTSKQAIGCPFLLLDCSFRLISD